MPRASLIKRNEDMTPAAQIASAILLPFLHPEHPVPQVFEMTSMA